MLLSSSDSTVVSQTWAGFLATALGPGLRVHNGLAASRENHSGPRRPRKGSCPGQDLGVSSGGDTPTSTSPVIGVVRDDGGGGRRGGQEGQKGGGGGEALLPGRKASCGK